MSLIAAVEGVLEEKGVDYALVGMGGVTLRVHIPVHDLAQLGGDGSTVRLRTHLVVRADDLQLYGFATEHGCRLFQALLDVSGVGPKVALAVLSIMPPESVAMAIVAGDAATLSQAQGVGKRTAERIVLDLKGKLEEEFGPSMVLAKDAPAGERDAGLQALVALGYSALEARQALSVEREEGLSVEERVRRALQRMGS
jgi:Holliday junction DNA helicase RuvA